MWETDAGLRPRYTNTKDPTDPHVVFVKFVHAGIFVVVLVQWTKIPVHTQGFFLNLISMLPHTQAVRRTPSPEVAILTSKSKQHVGKSDAWRKAGTAHYWKGLNNNNYYSAAHVTPLFLTVARQSLCTHPKSARGPETSTISVMSAILSTVALGDKVT